ncbi:reverse transcriptase [Gracilaria domingensis]|nr:reverse transcriptase [Gracilaria domingensis]
MNDTVHTLWVVVYVDDMLLIRDDVTLMRRVKSEMGRCFEVKTESTAASFLGVHMERGPDFVILHQQAFITEVLNRFNMLESRAIDTPLSSSARPSDLLEGDPISFSLLYQEAVGALLYLAGWTRADICYAVNLLARAQSGPTVNHWRAVKRIFC